MLMGAVSARQNETFGGGLVLERRFRACYESQRPRRIIFDYFYHLGFISPTLFTMALLKIDLNILKKLTFMHVGIM